MHPLLEETQHQLRQHVAKSEQRNPSVSAWSVGMHIEHCALAMEGMGSRLGASVTPEGMVAPSPPVKWSMPRLYVSVTGSIPRGKGKAPQAAVPEPSPPAERIVVALDTAEARIQTVLSLPEDAWYDHHVFGPFRRDKVLWFMGVHNKHHLKIIRDILK